MLKAFSILHHSREIRFDVSAAQLENVPRCRPPQPFLKGPLGAVVLWDSAPETAELPNGAARPARVTLVSAKVTKAMVPAGWPAPASPKQVPGSNAVLGARADRTSLSWRPSLDVLSRDPCARRPSRPPSKGTKSCTARRFAASPQTATALCRDVA